MDVTIEKDLVYGEASGEELKLDLARPDSGRGPFPLIVWIHGGGWQGGEKESHHWALQRWAPLGYVVATVDYRKAPLHKFPAQVEDVKCAVRYLRAHACQWDIDPQRVAAVGDSAGGHLALMLGLMNPEDGLEGSGGYSDQSSKVQSVVNYFGVTDFIHWELNRVGEILIKQGTGRDLNALIEDVLGTSDRDSAWVAQASPVTYVDPLDPPVLTFQGTRDYLVPQRQAEILHQALKQAGVEEELVLVHRGGHGFSPEDMEVTVKKAEEFLDRHLRQGYGSEE